MSKYIDADKLKAEIEYAKSVYDNPKRVIHGVADAFRQDGRAAMCDDILKKIASLQQEQSDNWNDEYREDELQTRFAFYTYKDEDDVLYLSNVFVEETSRNKGFGTKILAAAEKVAETLGIISIRLKVKQNSTANAWYRKHGYGYMAFEGDYDWLEKTLEYLKPKHEQPEVDLEKETIIDYVHNHYHYDKDFDGYGHSNLRPVFTREDLTELGRHFYELGLNARKV